MKILHVAPSIEQSYGGPTQSLAGYVAASTLAGCDVHIAAPRATEADSRRLRDQGANGVTVFESAGHGGAVRSRALVQWVSRNAASYDVIHVHGLFNFVSSFASRAVIKAGVPLVIRPFGTLSRYTFSHRRTALKRAWFTLLEKPNLDGAAGIHFTTSTERDEAAWHGLDLGRRAHIVPPPYLAQPSHHERARSGIGNTVLFVGRLHPVKNIEALVEAWAIVVRAIPDANLVIAGAGDNVYEAALRKRASDSGAGETISFPGFLSPAQRDEALAHAALFVLPSRHENFGMAALEALAAGVPVVFSPDVQLGDFVAGHHLGVITDPSPPALAAAIVQVLSDTSMRDRVANSGRDLVMSTYGAGSIGEKLRTMYLAVVETCRNHKTRTSTS